MFTSYYVVKYFTSQKNNIFFFKWGVFYVTIYLLYIFVIL